MCETEATESSVNENAFLVHDTGKQHTLENMERFPFVTIAINVT
jgi:hypothetical protein